MIVEMEVFSEQNEGRMKLLHSATNDDASDFRSSGYYETTNASGDKLHNTNMDNLLGLLVVNVGTDETIVKINTDSTPSSSVNLIYLLAGDFCFIPKPEHATSKTVIVGPRAAGDTAKVRYWISGD